MHNLHDVISCSRAHVLLLVCLVVASDAADALVDRGGERKPIVRTAFPGKGKIVGHEEKPADPDMTALEIQHSGKLGSPHALHSHGSDHAHEVHHSHEVHRSVHHVHHHHSSPSQHVDRPAQVAQRHQPSRSSAHSHKSTDALGHEAQESQRHQALAQESHRHQAHHTANRTGEASKRRHTVYPNLDALLVDIGGTWTVTYDGWTPGDTQVLTISCDGTYSPWGNGEQNIEIHDLANECKWGTSPADFFVSNWAGAPTKWECGWFVKGATSNDDLIKAYHYVDGAHGTPTVPLYGNPGSDDANHGTFTKDTGSNPGAYKYWGLMTGTRLSTACQHLSTSTTTTTTTTTPPATPAPGNGGGEGKDSALITGPSGLAAMAAVLATVIVHV